MNKLTITDQEGKVIEVTDLDAAIQQAEAYRRTNQLLDDLGEEFNEKLVIKRTAYWQDIHDKLIQIKNNQQ